MNIQDYEDYRIDNDSHLKEEYLMQFNVAQLIEMILDDDIIEEALFTDHRTFEEFCEKQFELHIEHMAEMQRDK